MEELKKNINESGNIIRTDVARLSQKIFDADFHLIVNNASTDNSLSSYITFAVYKDGKMAKVLLNKNLDLCCFSKTYQEN